MAIESVPFLMDTSSPDRTDPLFAVALLFVIIVFPPMLRIRLMYTACWLVFSMCALCLESRAALGIATSMGITVMVGWYALRIYDRSAFTAVLNGWLGPWSAYKMLGVAARVADLVIHLVLPLALLYLYLPHVRVWMCLPALVSSRLWIYFVVGGGLFPQADHVYRFVPPRSPSFWRKAYCMELVLNVLIPCCCEYARASGLYDQLLSAFFR